MRGRWTVEAYAPWNQTKGFDPGRTLLTVDDEGTAREFFERALETLPEGETVTLKYHERATVATELAKGTD